jgi:hypothetical protein
VGASKPCSKTVKAEGPWLHVRDARGPRRDNTLPRQAENCDGFPLVEVGATPSQANSSWLGVASKPLKTFINQREKNGRRRRQLSRLAMKS